MTDRPRIVFMGSPEFAVPALEALAAAGHAIAGVFTQPDRPAGRGRRLLPPPVKTAAERLGIATFQPERLRSREALATLQSLAPDLIVVAAFGQILRPAVLELPRLGCLNLHASLLPRHRGASPIVASILAGDAETGVSIMKMDVGLDTGPVLARRVLSIGPEETAGELTNRLADAGAALLVETLSGWIAGTLVPEPQVNDAATYAPLLEKAQAAIDWTKPAVQLAREVRAYNPWPLSFTRFSGETLQVLEAAALPANDTAGTPGLVVPLPAEPGAAGIPSPGAGFGVATASGVLVPLTLRRAGRNAVAGAEFLRGTHGLIGSVLG
jgi:methionyl-tRNA formyltransferase